MVIANGFITDDEMLALEEAKRRANGKDVRIAVMPNVCTMTYFVSDIGEMFGCQKMKNFCLTKPLKIEKKFSPGCSMRYAVGHKKQKQAYMQYIMYSTFVAGVWDDNLTLVPKDGNQYNYQTDNWHPKEEDHSVFLANLSLLQHIYRSNFLRVSHYVLKFSDRISFDDAKDIASKAFYELCRINFRYEPLSFVGLWKNQVKLRTFDFLSFRERFTDSVLWEDGSERFGKNDSQIEVADIWQHIRGDKRRLTMKLYCEGESPTAIAEIMGITRESVSSCITRTIQHLQSVYNKDVAV